MAEKVWVEVVSCGLGKDRAESAKRAEEVAVDLCVELGLMESEIKVTSSTYDGSGRRKETQISLRVYTNQLVAPYVLLSVPDATKPAE